MLGVFAKAVYVLDGIGSDRVIERLIQGFRLEVVLAAGLGTILAGLGADAYVLFVWLRSGGGTLSAHFTNLAIIGGTLLAIGVEGIFSGFFLSILRSSRLRRWT